MRKTRLPLRVVLLTVALVVAAAGLCAPVAGQSGAQATSVAGKRAGEVRGLWVLRSSLTSRQRIDELIKTATDGGYNTLLVQVRGRGDAYYDSDVDPRASDLNEQPLSFDPLKVTLDAAHAAGLKVHAWINVNLVASAATLPRSREHIVSRQPGWLMVPRELAPTLLRLDARTPGYIGQLARWTRAKSETVEGLFLSPIPEGAQQYTLSVITDLMRSYVLDGAHLDYIRYPSADFDYSKVALQAFRSLQAPKLTMAERDRLDGLAKTDPLVWTRAYPDTWANFRRQRLTTLVTRIREVVKRERPNALVSSAVVPDPVEARDRKLQDWSAWAETGLLDVVCPMAYASKAGEFAEQIRAATDGAQGRPVWAGIGAWRLPVGRAAEHLRMAREAGASGVLLFSYDSLLTVGATRGTYFTQLRPTLVATKSGDPQ